MMLHQNVHDAEGICQEYQRNVEERVKAERKWRAGQVRLNLIFKAQSKLEYEDVSERFPHSRVHL